MRALLLLACVVAAAVAVPASVRAQDAVITVTLLGTGAPPPLPERFGPATLVRAGDQVLLFDAGRGAAIRMWQVSVGGSALDATFLTHLHSDHVVGLPDLWLTGWVRGRFGGRLEPFHLIGPPGTADLAANLERAFAADIRFRIAGGLPASGSRIRSEEFHGDGVVYDVDGLRVVAFRVDHGRNVDHAFGYRIDYHGRSVVISGDARPSESLATWAAGVDLLIHEVAVARLEHQAAAAVVLDQHTTPDAAGRLFTATRPRLAVYSHIARPELGGPPADIADLITQTRAFYSGPLRVGEDLMTFDILTTGEVVERPPSL